MGSGEGRMGRLGLFTRVVVQGKTSVGCRPVVCPEGSVIGQSEGGLVRILLQDGSRRWFRPEDLRAAR